MLTRLLISTLESAFSHAIKHQITNHKRWTELYEKPILLHLEQPKISFYFIIHSDKITLRKANEHETVTVSMTTTLSALLQSLQGKRTKDQIQIQGQNHIATLLSKYIHSFKPNYEDMLEPLIGKSMAYGMTSQIKKACEKIKKDGDNLKHSTGDYIQHELNLSPSKQAAKKFYTEVDTLHNQIDLLEAKLRKLEEERIPR
ncbi:MAG: hypothetical protein VX737_05155 [Pseudomonadota bacterium]|nr:hypothetical protein [Pseudomonadota bacterium]